MTHAYISGCLFKAYGQYQYTSCCQDAALNVDWILDSPAGAAELATTGVYCT